MCDVILKRGMERVEVESGQITAEVLRRTFRVRMHVVIGCGIRVRNVQASFN